MLLCERCNMKDLEMVLCIIVLSFYETFAAGSSCSSGWESAGKYCYKGEAKRLLSFECAEAFCKRLGGLLPEPPDSIEADEFGSWWASKRTGLSPWLGAVTKGKPNDKKTWKFRNSGDIMYENKWAPAKPDPTPAHKCAYQDHFTKLWHNDVCTAQRAIVCQYDPSVGIKLSGRPCPEGFVATKGETACYKWFKDAPDMDHHKALKFCASQSGTFLPMFRNDEDVTDMRDVIDVPSLFHLGANMLKVKDVYEMDNPEDPCKMWLPWAPGQPNDSNEKCPAFNKADSKSHDWMCKTEMGVVCQFRLPNFGCGKCEEGYIEIDTNCYKLGMPQTYKSAYDTCVSEGAQLVEFHSQDEQKKFLKAWAPQSRCGAPEIPGFWLGLRSWPSSNLNYDASWRWASGAGLAYAARWSAGAPSGREDCAAVRIKKDSYEFTNMFGCKAYAEHQTVCYYKQFPGRCTKCEKGWTLVGNHCYHARIFFESFDRAKTHCDSLDSTLPIYTEPNSTEYYKLISYMRLTDLVDFWIGLEPTDHAATKLDSKHSTWKWIDGSPMTFPFIENSGVRTDDYPHHCVYAEMIHGRWQNNVPCATAKSVICQKAVNAKCLNRI